eukprot:COSAG02_NODE_3325_length_6935_cov_28.660913_11_plen_58_part_01
MGRCSCLIVLLSLMSLGIWILSWVCLGAGVYRVVLGVLSSAISAVMYRIVGKGQRFVG